MKKNMCEFEKNKKTNESKFEREEIVVIISLFLSLNRICVVVND